MNVITRQEPLSDAKLWGSHDDAQTEAPPCPLKTETGQCPEGCHFCRHWPEPFEPTF